ncbi:MAG: lytic transglycosylase domain-containing protein [Sarcina sp.]
MKALKVSIITGIVIIIVVTIIALAFFQLRNKFLPYEYNQYIEEYSQEYNLNPNFVRAIIKAESGYNPMIISNAGAYGLMQITKQTGYIIASNLDVGDFNESMLFNPKINIQFGCWYLNNLEQEFHNQDDVIAAYNAGRGNVQQWLKNKAYSTNGVTLNNIPFSETAAYVKNVNLYEKLYSKLY